METQPTFPTSEKTATASRREGLRRLDDNSLEELEEQGGWDTSPEVARSVVEDLNTQLNTIEFRIDADEDALSKEYTKQLNRIEENNREVARQQEAAEKVAAELLEGSSLDDEQIAEKASLLNGSLETILDRIQESGAMSDTLEEVIGRYKANALASSATLAGLRERLGGYLNAALEGNPSGNELDSVGNQIETAVARLDNLSQRVSLTLTTIEPQLSTSLMNQSRHRAATKERTVRVMSDIQTLRSNARKGQHSVEKSSLTSVRQGVKDIPALPPANNRMATSTKTSVPSLPTAYSEDDKAA